MDYLNYFTGKRRLFVKTKEFMSGIHKVELYVLGYFVCEEHCRSLFAVVPLENVFQINCTHQFTIFALSLFIIFKVRAVMGPQSYLLKAYEELWVKELSEDVENILK